ncbi:hypothetical protein B9Z19DRAFT_1148560 [Tuber borchii]|uniref:HNH nuclease domain-containing protein n=1 Tax=Tuber borchii TaxID=42251 RepID=A0A2T6ZMG1_TUBBO|nr:hypothetical protein B9Z19DRAFT_1148560 [Tuber borchii]
MYKLFDSHHFSINPDDDYKIVCFTPIASVHGIAGRKLDQRLLHDLLRPIDHLLCCHFRQGVLVNVMGARECFLRRTSRPAQILWARS